jgi:geranylgeranyl diphosphate synthase type II
VNQTLAEWASPRLAALEAALGAAFADAEPARMREAALYPLQTGGKRVRPLLAFAACEAVGGRWEDALDAAVAVELLHTYSLVHDDLPCMDDDSERRGRPTAHVVFGENVAVLAGDALLTEAFVTLTRYPAALARSLVAELGRAGGAGGMIGGQAYDIGLAGPVRDLDGLFRLHRLKTGALIRAACRMGALAGGAQDLTGVSCIGEAIGLAFQIHDDVLDAGQDADEDGPPSFVKLVGVDGAARMAREQVELALTEAARMPNGGMLAALARFTVDRAF